MQDKKYISIPELARLLGLSRIAVYRKVKQGTIPAIRIGRTYGVRQEAVDSLLGHTPNDRDKAEIEAAVKRTVKEYGEVLKLLGDA